MQHREWNIAIKKFEVQLVPSKEEAVDLMQLFVFISEYI